MAKKFNSWIRGGGTSLKGDRVLLVFGGAVLCVIVLNSALSGSSNAPLVSDAAKQNPMWSFDVTCGDIENNPDLAREVAVDNADYVNSPLGINDSIERIEAEVFALCSSGVDPSYAPVNQAAMNAADSL